MTRKIDFDINGEQDLLKTASLLDFEVMILLETTTFIRISSLLIVSSSSLFYIFWPENMIAFCFRPIFVHWRLVRSGSLMKIQSCIMFITLGYALLSGAYSCITYGLG